MQEAAQPRLEPGAGLQGKLEALGLSSLLALIEMERKSAVITMRIGEEEAPTLVGQIVCQEGKIASARVEEQQVLLGKAAVFRMMHAHVGSFAVRVGKVKLQASLELPIMHVLMEGAQLHDEAAAPPDPPGAF